MLEPNQPVGLACTLAPITFEFWRKTPWERPMGAPTANQQVEVLQTANKSSYATA